MNDNRIDKYLEGLTITPEQALQALDSVISIKFNEMVLEGHLYSGTEFHYSDARFEYLALLEARKLLQKEVEKAKDKPELER